MPINTSDLWFTSTLRDLIVGQVASNGGLRGLALSLGLDWDDIERRAGVVWEPAPTPRRLPETAELRGLDGLNELDVGRFLWTKDQHEKRRQ